MEINNSYDLKNTEIRDPFLIVGIGASAGGIHALKAFFQHVPVDSGIAYVVILHLSPDHDSQLASVLQVVCAIPVLQVTENTKILPDHVYVIPPNKHLVLQDGFIAPSVNVHLEERRAPVDIFFRNLADTHGQRAVCVILSGTGANGSMGMKRVKEMGGAAYVQNPREAEFNEMPRNAIATNLVDEVLPVREIPARIMAYRSNLGTVQINVESEKRPEPQQRALRQIFTELRMRTGHDFSNYKRPTLLRRIERRLHIRNLSDLPSYATFLHQNADESNALLKDLLISVTNFFRDKKPFSAIEQEILPSILKGKSANDQVRIWVAGCATGEEVYSIAMLCAELTIDIINAPRIQIFATDIDDTAINAARDGFYTINDAADVSAERLRRFFQPEGDGYKIRREIREMILFANHNFLKDPPFSRLDLITCRNVLIYLNTAAQKRVMETFHFALKPGGFLFLGTSESVDDASDLYTTFSRENHIFQAREVSAHLYPVPESIPSPLAVNASQQKLDDKELVIVKRLSSVDLHHKLLELYAPPSVVINEEYEIIHLSDSVGKYFEFHGGEPTKNLLQLVRSELRLELRSALYKAIQQRTPVRISNLQLIVNGKAESINLLIRPVLRELDLSKGYILVVFEQNENITDTDAVLITSDEPVAKQLEEELIAVKFQLRNYVEQHELQAEELNARNEELQAMNEELRSSSEELETGKEELQSINEELRTVNQELKVKIEETSVAGNNLQNLVNSADVATIFLDRNFRIRMFTPAVFEIFNLRPSDHGRPITDITNKLEFSNLLQDAKTVLEKLTVIERELTTTDHRSFLMRLLPYRTTEDSINGVVITFYEITKRRDAEKALQRSEEHLRLLIESAKDYAIFTMDPNRRVVSWSFGAETIMGFSEAEIKGQSADIIFTVEDQQNGAPAREAEIADKEGRAENERWHLRKNGSRFWASGSVSPLRDQNGKLLGFVKIMRDLTETRRLEEARFFLASIVESTNDSIITINFERTITSWNKAAENLYGYTAQEAIGKSLTMLTLPADLLEILKNIDKIEHGKQVTVFDTMRVHKNGQHIDLEIVLSPVLNNSGETIGVSTIARNVTERKRREAHLALLADLSQGLIGLSVTSDIGQEVLKKIGNFFGASICAFTQIFTNEHNPLHFETWLQNDNKHINGKDDLPEYGEGELLAALSQGKEVIISDITLDSRVGKKEKVSAGSIVSLINVPLMRSGKWSCSIGVYLDRPYDWRQDEVALLRETGIRIWNSIERAQAEEASRISEDRFHTLIDAIPQVIWTNDIKGKADYFNQRWFEYSGLTFEESYGLGWEAIVHPDDAPASKNKWRASLAAGEIFDTEYRLKNARGEYRWHIGRNIPLKDNHGQVVGWFGSATDIEVLKGTEALLRQTADRLQLALDAGQLGSYEYNFKTNETVCTAQHKKHFGFLENDECPFSVLKELSVAEDREYVEKALTLAIEQHTFYSIEFRIEIGKDTRWIKSVGRTIADQQGNTEKMVGITLDITEQKLFTNQLQKQVDERTIELQRSNDDLRQFAHVASHDLKEPVRKIKTFYSRIVDEFSDTLPEKVKTYLAKINTATNRMYAMVDGVLAYSKLGSYVKAYASVDLNDVVQQIETDLEVLISTKNATITRDELPTLTASEVLMYQLFYNLIMNALKFSRDGHPANIDISSKRLRKDSMDVFEIAIADNGIGFEPEFEQEIFNTFSRLNSADKYEGTGLGLALCKKIVERHHGSISASSQLNKGATFTILLPAD